MQEIGEVFDDDESRRGPNESPLSALILGTTAMICVNIRVCDTNSCREIQENQDLIE